MNCPLCNQKDATLFLKAEEREYWHCRSCDLRFVPERFHLNEADELARYNEHENETQDPAYRAFLSRTYDPLKPKLSAGAHGLDFGSGPGPALAAMMREEGFTVDLYDKYFANTVPNQTYDFVTCTETAEHFRAPKKEFALIASLLKPGGWLALMTGESPTEQAAFSQWYYHRDPTHVSFYTAATIQWLAKHFGWTYSHVGPNVWLLQKRMDSLALSPSL